ncbi:hypothetical protein J7E95_27710, partial [Streptomyces sp. ISL-14]|nr:hypothetical protein [Streptomyces sp. ISL-14]
MPRRKVSQWTHHLKVTPAPPLRQVDPLTTGGLERSGHAGEGGRHRLEGHVAAVGKEPGDGQPSRRRAAAGRRNRGATGRPCGPSGGVRGQEVVLPDDAFALRGAGDRRPARRAPHRRAARSLRSVPLASRVAGGRVRTGRADGVLPHVGTLRGTGRARDTE